MSFRASLYSLAWWTLFLDFDICFPYTKWTLLFSGSNTKYVPGCFLKMWAIWIVKRELKNTKQLPFWAKYHTYGGTMEAVWSQLHAFCVGVKSVLSFGFKICTRRLFQVCKVWKKKVSSIFRWFANRATKQMDSRAQQEKRYASLSSVPGTHSITNEHSKSRQI